ncbi:uncharacterized protein LOC124817859 [Hydra vulgaris]|uniref:uncharacterized protein LOC124817859 n=1 Tax=Hydra vulgaris TaxID=6087 RepID=UPI001F5EE410|nr:uncharacterized protein LOC124817859 [Hydra vulgaris]
MFTNYLLVGIGYGVMPIQIFGIYVLHKAKNKLVEIEFLILLAILLIDLQMVACLATQILCETLNAQKALKYITIYLNIGLSFEQYCIIYILIASKFSEIYFNLRYDQIWKYNRVKAALTVITILSIMLTACFMIFDLLTVLSYFCFVYLFPVTNGIILVTIFSTFMYIFYKYYQLYNRKVGELSKSSFNGKAKNKKKFERFFKSLLGFSIVVNYALFSIIPGIIIGCLVKLKPSILSYGIYFNTFFYFGTLTDVIICIFLSSPMRNQFKKMFSHLKTKKEHIRKSTVHPTTISFNLEQHFM